MIFSRSVRKLRYPGYVPDPYGDMVGLSIPRHLPVRAGTALLLEADAMNMNLAKKSC